MTIRDAAQQLVNRFRETTAVHDEVAELELELALANDETPPPPAGDAPPPPPAGDTPPPPPAGDPTTQQ